MGEVGDKTETDSSIRFAISREEQNNEVSLRVVNGS